MTSSQHERIAPTTNADARSGRFRNFVGEDPAVMVIALGAGIASFAMNFWIPFLPLFLLDVGATSDANALFWIGIATSSQGVARLVSGPVWGMLADRMGRKLMFVRALFFASITTVIAAAAQEPWHIAVAFACQGLFSGFIPAAVALTSVSVPDHRLNNSLGMVTGAQYLGNVIGPAVGSGLAFAFGLRGAIVAAAIMPGLAALLVMAVVPRDRVATTSESDTTAGNTGSKGQASFMSLIGFQFLLALFLYFFLFGSNQLVRLTTPIALSEMADNSAEGLTGIAFTLAGITSVIGVMVIARRLPHARLRTALVISSVLTGVVHLALAAAGTIPLFIVAFSIIALFQAAMLPASNTLIASSVPRNRRGMAFGLAGSAQALAFMVGPTAAAGFAAISMSFGFAVVGLLFFGLGALLFLFLRPPDLSLDSAT